MVLQVGSLVSAQHCLASACLGYSEATLLYRRRTPRGSRDTVLTDHEVELVRQVYEMGGISMLKLAAKFEVSKSHIHDIISFRRRSYAYSWAI